MSMRTSKPSVLRTLVGACAVAMLMAPVFPRIAAAADAPKEWDGLEQRPSKSVALLYVRPGASLSGYTKVRLEPLYVAFDKNWDPNVSRTGNYRLNKDDLEKIKKGLAEEFAKVCTETLTKGGYQVVSETGEDVLDVTPMVIDLYIVAPQKMTAGRSYTYTTDTGRMTLVAELRDSETGQILARVVDKRWAPANATMQLTTSVSNMSAAREVIKRWADALRKALDVANGKTV
jgi:uncharacterized protein DUF3313